MDNLIDVRDQAFSFFGNTSKFEGKFHLNGRTHICSQVKGEVTMEDESPLIIEQTGSFDGTLKCHDLFIHGTLSGEIFSEGTVTISSSANVNGKVKAKNLVIEPGSEVNLEGHTLS